MNENTNSEALALFATTVIKVQVEGFEDLNAQLRPMIFGQKAASAGVSLSNFGGWQSNDQMMMWAPREARTLLQTAIAACAPHTADTHPAGKRDFEFDANMWANVNSVGDSNNAHAHPGCLWSCVYYVDDGRLTDIDEVGGELMLEDPRFPMNVMYMPGLVNRGADGVPQTAQHPVTPKTGMLVIFPSWLRHSVRPYLGSKDRVSVAFNLMVNVAEPD